jgi:NADH:ubiquinone oxidoreductase subunit K
MDVQTTPWLDPFNTALSLLLFSIGFFCLVTQRSVLKQVVGLKIMLQGVTLGLIHAGQIVGDTRLAEGMVISALVVEAVVIALALALIVNIYRYYPAGDVDHLDRLKG